MQILKGEAGRRISNKGEELKKQGMEMTGLQTLWMLYQEFTTDEKMYDLFDITNLSAITCKGQEDLERFAHILAGVHACHLKGPSHHEELGPRIRQAHKATEQAAQDRGDLDTSVELGRLSKSTPR